MKTEKYTHTPGPWETRASHVFKAGKNGANVCTCGSPRSSKFVGYSELQFSDPDIHEAYANAHLIAAAPDLLEACEAALEVVNDCDPDTVRMYAPILRAAIAKATNNAEKTKK